MFDAVVVFIVSRKERCCKHHSTANPITSHFKMPSHFQLRQEAPKTARNTPAGTGAAAGVASGPPAPLPVVGCGDSTGDDQAMVLVVHGAAMVSHSLQNHSKTRM